MVAECLIDLFVVLVKNCLVNCKKVVGNYFLKHFIRIQLEQQRYFKATKTVVVKYTVFIKIPKPKQESLYSCLAVLSDTDQALEVSFGTCLGGDVFNRSNWQNAKDGAIGNC